MDIDTFTQKVRSAVQKDALTNTSRSNRKYHPVLDTIYSRHGCNLPARWRRFIENGLLPHFECASARSYKSTAEYEALLRCWLHSFYQASCRHCGKPVSRPGPILAPSATRVFCSTSCGASSEAARARRVSTCMQRYGVDHPSKSSKVTSKIADTMNARYGGHTLASTQLKTKVAKTMRQKYGTEHASAHKGIKAAAVSTYLSRHGRSQNPVGADAVSLRRKQTFIERYGVTHQSKVPQVTEKTRATLLGRYGVERIGSSPEIRAKISATNLMKYGHTSPMASSAVSAKVRSTMLARYGVEYPMQNPASRLRQVRSALRIREVKVGHHYYLVQSKSEELVLGKLILHHGATNVLTQFSEGYPNSVLKEASTYPDFYLPRTDKFIEVKSMWTFMGREGAHRRSLTEGDLSKNKAKARAAAQAINLVWIVDIGKRRVLQLPPDWYTWRNAKIRRFVSEAAVKAQDDYWVGAS